MNNMLKFPPENRSESIQPPMVYVYKDVAWEYKHLLREEEHALTEEELNTLGAEGWELIGIVTDSRGVHFYFKRVRR